MSEPDLITIGEAMRRLNVSKHTIGRIVQEHNITVYGDPLDKRKRLVKPAEIERVKRLRVPVELPQGSKIAA